MKKSYFLIQLTALISFLICLFNSGNIDGAYSLVIIFPLVYCVFSFILCVMLSDKQAGSRLTVMIYLALQWLRNVLLPATASLSGYLSNAAGVADADTATLATYLCLFELVVTSIICCFLLKYSRRKEKRIIEEYVLSGNPLIYSVFILFAGVLFVLYGRSMFSFFALALTGVRASNSDRNVVIHSVIGHGLTFLMVLVVYYCYKQYQKTEKNYYFILALVVAVIRIGVISSDSESRISILYTMGIYALLLPKLFQGKRKTIVAATASMAIAMIFFMTIYKSFHAFLYDSYFEALSRQSDRYGLFDISSTINVNFYGVQNVARNLYVSQSINLTSKSFFADFINNTFGLNRLIKIDAPLTIAQYNEYIYSGRSSSGYLFSAVAYGYEYFSILLAPLATVINLLITAYIENLLDRFKSIDIFFIICTIYIRFAFTMFACFPISWNYVSRSLTIGLLMVFVASLPRFAVQYRNRSR